MRKKVLSILLAVAIVVSCLSMVCLFTGAEDAIAAKIVSTGTGAQLITPAGVTKGLTIDGDSTTITLTVYNGTDQNLKDIRLSYSWGTLFYKVGTCLDAGGNVVNDTTTPIATKGENYGHNGATGLSIAPGSYGIVTVLVPKTADISNVNGDEKLVKPNATVDDYSLRFDFTSKPTVDGYVLVMSDNQTVIDNLTKLSGGTNIKGYGSITDEASMPAKPVAKTVVNGDAESGDTGWGTKFAGTTTIVAEHGGHAAKFTPTVGNKYGTIAFSLGAAIIDDAYQGYQGGGVGIYKITFDAKADAESTFGVILNSKYHAEPSGIATFVGSGTSADYVSTYTTCVKAGNKSGITLGTDWASYEFYATVSEKMMNTLKLAYAAGKSTEAESAYDLFLRFDGSNAAYKDEQTIAYYLDNVAISKVSAIPTAEPTDTPEVTATPDMSTATPSATPAGATKSGIKIVVGSASNKTAILKGAETGDTPFDGLVFGTADEVKKVKFTVYNCTDQEITQFGLSYEWATEIYESGTVTVDGDNKITGGAKYINANKSVKIAPNTLTEIELEVPKKADFANSAKIYKKDVAFNMAGIRINFAGQPTDDGFVFLVADDATVNAYGAKTAKYSGIKAVEDKVLETLLPQPTPAPTATPAGYTPAPKAVANGDAENGLTNWGAFTAGKVELSTDTKSGSGKSVKYSKTDNQWGSVGFDLGPAVINDPTNGYIGGGAGKYTITFDAKATAGTAGAYSVMLNSKNHKDQTQVLSALGLTPDAANKALYDSVYSTGASVTLTTDWATYTGTVNVSEAMLNSIKALYASNADSYVIYFRLDGSKGAFKDAAVNDYYLVDNISIKKEDTPTPTPTAKPGVATPTPVPGAATPTPGPGANPSKTGFKNGIFTVDFENESDVTNYGVNVGSGTSTWDNTVTYGGSKGSVKKAGGKNHYDVFGIGGDATKKVITKAGTYAVKAKVYVAKAPNGDCAYCGKPAETAMSLNLRYKNEGGSEATQNLVSNVLDAKQTGKWLDVIASFEIKDDQIADVMTIGFDMTGSNSIIYFDEIQIGTAAALGVKGGTTTGGTTTGGTTTGGNTDGGGSASCTGIVYTIKEDVSKPYFITKAGIINKSMIKDGEITVKYQIFNESEQDISLKPSLQTTADKNGTATWAGPGYGESVEIAAGESEWVEVTVEVNDDGTITVLDNDYPVNKFFLRLDFSCDLEKGTKFVIACNSKDSEYFTGFGTGNKSSWSAKATLDTKYGTGDALPVAIIAVVAVTAVALFVVAKKKKEEI